MKLVVRDFPFPLTISLLQSFVPLLGFVWVITSRYVSNTAKPRNSHINLEEFLKLWRWGVFLGSCSILGSTLHRTSLMFVHVSFVHTIKACQPLFAVVVSRLWLGDRLPLRSYLALLPIVAGVSIAAFTETEFHFGGFLASIFSSLAFCLTNMGSKRVLTLDHVSLDKDALFYFSSFYATMLLFVLWPVTEAGAVLSHTTHPHTLALLGAGALLNTLQGYLSLTILSLVSPVSHSVASCFKRIFVITAAILYFANRVTVLNVVGICLSSFGVGLYQYTRKTKMSPVSSVANLAVLAS